MQDLTIIGKNKTGIKFSPEHAKELLEDVEELTTKNLDSRLSIGGLRMEYIADAASVDTQASLADKLGERLAFERSSVRLYEAILTKCRNSKMELPLVRLEAIQQQELEHFMLLHSALETLGADPTAQTPCADAVGVQGIGLIQVVTDPRTSIAQSLNAALTAELTDNAAWELLIQMCHQGDHADIANGFQKALAQEAEHLETIKSLVTDLTLTGTAYARI